jgi:hypothetical protein
MSHILSTNIRQIIEKINNAYLLLYSVYKIEFAYILHIVMQQTLQQSETKLTLLPYFTIFVADLNCFTRKDLMHFPIFICTSILLHSWCINQQTAEAMQFRQNVGYAVHWTGVVHEENDSSPFITRVLTDRNQHWAAHLNLNLPRSQLLISMKRKNWTLDTDFALRRNIQTALHTTPFHINSKAHVLWGCLQALCKNLEINIL